MSAASASLRDRGARRRPLAIPWRWRSPSRGQHGFTLLELALTLLIVAILVGIAIPRLPSLGRTDLEASADRLATVMTYLADESSLRGRIYRLTLDLDDESWTVAAIAPFARPDSDGAALEFRRDDDDPLARGTSLPRGVTLDEVIDHDGSTTAGQREIFFLPEGLAESVRVVLGEDGGAKSSVLLDAVRGSAWREETEAP